MHALARSLFLVALLVAALPQPAAAFDFGNMMSPSRWFNGNRDRDDYYNDDYYGPPGGGYGYPGYSGYPSYAPGAYGAPGYAAPGYAAPGYAAPGYTTPAYTAPSYSSPAATDTASSRTAPITVIDADAAEIARLKQRVRELEEGNSGSVDTWQVPAESAAGTQSGNTYYPSGGGYSRPAGPDTHSGDYNAPLPTTGWQPGIPGSGSGNEWNRGTSAAERGAADYVPPPQYPGQPTYEFR